MTNRSSSGGAGAARGVGVEPWLFAWLAAHALAREPLPKEDWVPKARVSAVGLQTAEQMDDVGVLTDAGGRVFIQSKNGLELRAAANTDLGAAVDQAVAQYLAGTGDRGIEEARDRLVIVTDGSASRLVRSALASVVDRLATLPTSLAATGTWRNVDEEKALKVLLSHVERAWAAQTGRKPSEDDLRGLFRVLRVRVLRLDEGQHDRIVAESLLRRVLTEPERVSAAFEMLRNIGEERNKRQQWYRHCDLIWAIEREFTLIEGSRDERRQSIERMLEAQVAAAELFPHSLIEEHPAIASEAYVRQVFTSLSTDHELDTAHDAAGPRKAGLGTVALQSFHDMLSRSGSRHFLVFGEPGLGKSTLTLQETARLARQALDRASGEAQPWLPLRVSAFDLAGPEESMTQTIWRAAMRALGSCLDRPLSSNLLTAAADERWLLLIDGLDEISDPAMRNKVVKTLARYATRRDSRMRLLITTRPLPAAQMALLNRAGFDTYSLQSFDHERLTAFAKSWFGDEAAANRFLSHTHRAGSRELIRVPLLATVAAILHEQDPQRPLPTNRYALYQQYRTYLRSSRTATPRAQSPRTSAEDELQGRIDELLHHLAETHIAGNEPDLLVAACQWTETAIGSGAISSVASWPELIGAALANTGLLVRTGSGLRFVHASFAEHLTAEAHAELLPTAFDADDPDWQSALSRALLAQIRTDIRHDTLPEFAPEAPDNVARGALVHYTYLRPEAGVELVRHLQMGGPYGRLLASHLLAEGGLSVGKVVREPLVAVFLAQLRDAVHHRDDRLEDWFYASGHIRARPVADYLRALAQDRRYSTYERVRAARALAVCHPQWATDALRAVAVDEATDPNALWWVAGAFHEADPTQTEYVASTLRSVLDHPAVAPDSRRRTAEALAALGGTCRQEAAAVLIESATDVTATPSDRLDAARLLGTLGSEFSARTKDALWAVYRHPDADEFVTAEALGELDVLDPTLAHTEAEAICAELAHTIDRPDVVRNAVILMTALGPHQTEATTAALRTLIANPHTSDQTRETAERELRQLLPREESPVPAPINRPDPLPATAPEAPTARLRRILTDLESAEEDRLDAARELSELGPAETDRGAAMLRNTLAHVGGSKGLLTYAQVTGELGRAYAPEAARVLRKLIADPTASVWHRKYAALTFIGLGPEYAANAFEALQALVSDPSIDEDGRREAILTMGQIRPPYAQQAAEYLRRLIAASEVNSPADRRVGAEALGSLGPLWAEEAACVLRQIMWDGTTAGAERLDGANSLRNLGHQYEEEAIAFLRTFMLDRTESKNDRFRACIDLYDLAEEYGHETNQVLEEVAPRLFEPPQSRPPGGNDSHR
ncbi:NACHT domain-containing protein [Streptomyces albidoflavus]|uniref:NACHT domain-containing protein n=1 Tax=Streptomyces albidoflavus TaxID=1886 RepID=UPI00342B91A8